MAFKSRDMTLEKDSTVLAGLTSKSLNMGATAIDITSDDSLGFRTLLAGAVGVETLDLEASGVLEDDVIADIMLDPTKSKTLTDISLVRANGDTITGTFHVTSYSESGTAPDGRVEFSFSLQSSGTWVFTQST